MNRENLAHHCRCSGRFGNNIATVIGFEKKIPSVHLASEDVKADLEWYSALERARSEITRNERDV